MIQHKANNELYDVGCMEKLQPLMKLRTKGILLILREKPF